MPEEPSSTYRCHCCDFPGAKYVQHYVLRRSLAVAPIFECPKCGSVSVHAEEVRRHYPNSASTEAIEFHNKIRDRNLKWGEQLLRAIATGPNRSQQHKVLIDIGCAIGTLLSAAANQGLHGVGYEIDKLAAAQARRDARLKIHEEFFTRNSTGHAQAIVSCIAVLEHLKRPLELLGEIAIYCGRHHADAFISVPMLPNEWRPFLRQSVRAPGNPFFDNEEHISHFTPKQFEQAMAMAFDAQPYPLVAGGWAGYLVLSGGHA